MYICKKSGMNLKSMPQEGIWCTGIMFLYNTLFNYVPKQLVLLSDDPPFPSSATTFQQYEFPDARPLITWLWLPPPEPPKGSESSTRSPISPHEIKSIPAITSEKMSRQVRFLLLAIPKKHEKIPMITITVRQGLIGSRANIPGEDKWCIQVGRFQFKSTAVRHPLVGKVCWPKRRVISVHWPEDCRVFRVSAPGRCPLPWSVARR